MSRFTPLTILLAIIFIFSSIGIVAWKLIPAAEKRERIQYKKEITESFSNGFHREQEIVENVLMAVACHPEKADSLVTWMYEETKKVQDSLENSIK